MSGKLKIQIYVDGEIYQAFKDYVFSKYGTLNKYLGDEISRAMDQYLKSLADTHTQEIEHTISNPNKRHIQLLIWLLENFPNEVLYSDIKEYINDNYGFDRRTVKKYIHDFLINGGFVEKAKLIRGNNFLLKVKTERIMNYLSKFISEKEMREKYGIEIRQDKGKEINAYAVERYEAGDSIEEITDKLSDFGVELSKKEVKNLIQDVFRREVV